MYATHLMSLAGEILKNAATSAIAAHPGVCTSSGMPSAGRLHLRDRLKPRSGFLQVRRVAAHRAACDQVLAGVGVDHELLRLRAAHGARIGFDGDKLQPAAREDSAIGRVVQIVALVEPRRVDVEGIAVLHDELAHAQQSRLGPRLVAKLGLDLVPDLRQLLVAAQFAARDRRS